MSTKKEKCCEKCLSTNGWMKGECFNGNCTCHQSESIEWEKDLDYNQTDLGEMGKFIRVEYAKNILKNAITTAVSNREKEIAEEVEKLEAEEDGFGVDYLCKEDVLKILKH